MKKIIFLLLIVVLSNNTNGQCRRFLAGDKYVMPCSDTFRIFYDQIFVGFDPLLLNCTFSDTLLSPVDTFHGNNGMDSVIHYMMKVKVFATATNGCMDSAIVRVLIRKEPIPHLGPDTTVTLKFSDTATDISILYELFDYHTIIWGRSIRDTTTWGFITPEKVPVGTYFLVVGSLDGCQDTAKITVKCPVRYDTAVGKCPFKPYDLTKLFNDPGYTYSWDTPDPSAVEKGTYKVIARRANVCTDSAFVTVFDASKPDLGADKIIRVCKWQTVDLTSQFVTTGLATNWNVQNPTAVDMGNYRLIATNSDGCADTVLATINNFPKPNLGRDTSDAACPKDDFLNLENYFNLTGLTAVWNTPEPTSAGPGNYQLIVANSDGCKDTAKINIAAYPKPAFLNDTTVKICSGKTINLNTVYPTTGITIINWSTPTPAAAEPGTYIVTVEDNIQFCQHTAVVTVQAMGVNTEALSLCKYDQISTNNIFTTNAFRSITIDKNGYVWAGADEGGIYRFTPSGDACGGAWQKNTLSGIDITYKDLHTSIVPGDNSIWAASTGKMGAYNYSGGVDHFTSFPSVPKHYGSVELNPSGGLRSRNANSLAMGTNNKVYVALGQSLQKQEKDLQDTTLEGGVYQLYMPSPADAFSRVDAIYDLYDGRKEVEIKYSAAGTRANEVWFARQRSCLNSNCTNAKIIILDVNGNSIPGEITENNSPIPFNNTALIVRAIFTDAKGRTFVGLNSGFGFAVLEAKEPNTTPLWTLVTQNNSPLPDGAAVNFNAITEVNGEIWIGTNKGILVYNGLGSFTECASYKLYNITNGLPSDNVTDITYDAARTDVWFTTDAGVCKILKETELIGLEVTQVIQDWKGSIPLIEHKVTVVRAHLQSTGNAMRLYLYDQPPKLIAKGSDGRQLKGSPLIALNADEYVLPPKARSEEELLNRRKILSNSLNFRLPMDWISGTIDLSLEDPDIKCQETADIHPRDCRTIITFKPAKTLELKIFREKWKDENGIIYSISEENFNNDRAKLKSELRTLLPIDSISEDHWSGKISKTGLYLGTIKSKMGEDYWDVVSDVNFKQLESIRDSEPDQFRLYVGLIRTPDNWNGNRWGWGGIANGVSRDIALISEGELTATHELGHLLGRDHVLGACTETATQNEGSKQVFPEENYFENRPYIGPLKKKQDDFVFGYDTRNHSIKSPKCFEVMSYCFGDLNNGEGRWISGDTYNKIYEWMEQNYNTGKRHKTTPFYSSGNKNQSAELYKLFRGTINLTNQKVDFDPVILMSYNSEPLLVPGADYKLQLLDEQNNLIASINFEPTKIYRHNVSTNDEAYFVVPVSLQINVKKVLILKNDVVIGQKISSNIAPKVKLLYPNGGEWLNENPATIRWEASDEENDSLTYGLYFSGDGGNTWEAVSINLSDKTYEGIFNSLGETQNGLFRITVSDGINVAMDESDGFISIPNSKPFSYIVEPMESAIFVGEGPVFFKGTGSDVEDGDLTGASLTWSSTKDGLLGNGDNFYKSATDLTEGEHIIIFKAIDKEGASVSDSVKIKVLRTTNKVTSLKSGNWSDPATWSNNQIPDSTNEVTIIHSITVDINANCKSLKVSAPGTVQVNTGLKLNILKE